MEMKAAAVSRVTHGCNCACVTRPGVDGLRVVCPSAHSLTSKRLADPGGSAIPGCSELMFRDACVFMQDGGCTCKNKGGKAPKQKLTLPLPIPVRPALLLWHFLSQRLQCCTAHHASSRGHPRFTVALTPLAMAAERNVLSRKLVLLGDTAVGKSCLVVRFVRDEVRGLVGRGAVCQTPR